MRVNRSPVWHLATVAKHDVNSDVTRSRKMVATTTSPTPTNEISTDDVTPTITAGEGLEPRPPHPTPSKWKNGRIATKIGTKTKFGTANSKIVVPNPKKQRIDHAHAPPLQNEKMLLSRRKLVPRPNSVRRIQKLWSRILENKGSTTPTPHPTKMKT